MAKKTDDVKFDEIHWLDVLAKGQDSTHAEVYPDAMQIKKVLSDNELKEASQIDLAHDRNRLMFTLKTIENEQKKSLLRNPVPWAIAASVVITLSLALNETLRAPDPIAPIAMNDAKETKEAKSITPEMQALKAPPVRIASAPKIKKTSNGDIVEKAPKERIVLAIKPPNESLSNKVEEVEVVPDIPRAASMPTPPMPPLHDEAEGYGEEVPPMPNCPCSPPVDTYYVTMIFVHNVKEVANEIQRVLMINGLEVQRTEEEAASNGGLKVELKFKLLDTVHKDIKAIFEKYNIKVFDHKNISLEILYI